MLSRAEMPGGGHKPWPQKKQGRHHAGSIRAPGFYRGGFAHGVRGPKTKFTMLGDATRLHGLRTALTIKHCQDDLVIVDDFSSLPYNDPQFLQDLAEARNWGYSALFVDLSADNVPQNLVEACEEIPSFNIFPLYGLNCYSMMKHSTLVLTTRVVEELERRILEHLYKTGPINKSYKYKDMKARLLAEGEENEDPVYTPFV